MPRTPWFDRTFQFSSPIGVFPSSVERVRGTPARLEEIIRDLPAAIHCVSVDGGWSIQEHVGHLWDLDGLHDGRLDDYSARAATLRAADVTNMRTRDANHNANSMENLLLAFRRARMHFVERLEMFDEEMIERSALHPRLRQPMRLADMVQFVAEHDDHHLATIVHLSRRLMELEG